jgi:hypothetical protein
MPVRACPDHSHKGFCNKYYSEMPSPCNYRLSFLMLIRNFIIASSSVGDGEEKSCKIPKRIKKSQYFIVLNFCSETCKRWRDKKRDKKKSSFNDILVHISHKKKKRNTACAVSSKYLNTSNLHNLFVFNWRYTGAACTSGTKQSIRDISGSFSYVPDFATASLFTLWH